MDNENPKKKFLVHINDEDYFAEAPLEQIPEVPPEQKKKFVVHIDDEAPFSEAEQQPQYKGEVYFTNRKPQKNTPAANTDASGAPQNGNTKKKAPVGLICLIFVAAFTAAFSLLGISCINDILAISRSEDTVTVNVPSNATTNEIIDVLADSGLVKQKAFCKLFYTAFDTVKNINKTKKPDPPVYLSGVYYVQKNMGLEGYLTEFKEIQQTNDTVTLTFQEGWTIFQMFERLEKFGVCSKDRLVESLKNTDFEHDFVADIQNNPDRTFKLEGYFFPETYEFFEESDPNSVIRKFLNEFENRWTDEYQARADELGMTRDEIMIIASIIQREAASTDQMALISSVIHNRLNHPVSWPTLGCDSTANYVNTYVAPNVSQSEAMNYEQNYNTYLTQGLPPGPICNPGEAAIKAALYPDDTSYYFFRHDKYGKIYMARTQAEHDANGNEVLRANSH